VIDGDVETVEDWDDETCLLDVEGENDETGQKDTVQACIASNFDSTQPADTIYLRFDFDETSVNGGNTMDGCWILDTEPDGFGNLAVCFVLGNSANLVLQSATGYDCNNTTPNTCPGATVNAITPTCLLDKTAVNAFDPPPPPTPDTVAAVECSVPMSDLGLMPGDVVSLLRACSYPGALTSSADCVNDGSTPFSIDTNTGGTSTPVELLDFQVD
jgi:hypothetical protein